ncbi:MAG: HEAT repeat domain-containing protein [Gemmatimonadales bacterium]
MPVPLTSLFAAAIYQVRASSVDPVGTERVLGLLTRAAAGSVVVFELDDERLLVNGVPVGGDAPGALLVRTALIEHDTSRLQLPSGLGPRQWGDVAEIMASAPGLFPSADHVRDALTSSVPGALLVASGRPAMSDALRAALFDLPGQVPRRDAASSALSSREAGRADFSTRLDPLLHAGAAAVEARDWPKVAQVVLDLQQLDAASDDATRTIIARERRRVAPPHVIDSLVRELPRPPVPPEILPAIHALGNEGATALVEALNGAPGRAERRAYIDALVAAPQATDALVTALGSHRPDLVAGAAEVAGLRRMERAVPALTGLLRHAEATVRTAAYRALEEIATPEAMAGLARRS